MKYLNQDFGCERVTDCKSEFANNARSYLNDVAKILTSYGYTPVLDRKSKPMKPVNYNAGGVAVSGEVTLQMNLNELKVYVCISETCLNHVPHTKQGIAVMYRNGFKNYATDGNNIWVDVTLSSLDLANLIKR